jgi:hypothetical protein
MELFFKPQDQYDDTKMRHNYYLNLYYGVFSNILSNLFTFKNLDIILSNDLKKCFFSSYYVGAYKDKDDKLLFTPLEPTGVPNVLGDYREFKPLLYNNEQIVTSNDIVIGCDKTMRTLSDKIICYIFANKIADVLISIDTAIVDSRINNIFVGSENEIKDMLTSWEKRNIGVPVTVELPNKDNFDVRVEQLVKPTAVTEFYNSYRDIINEFMITTGLASIVNPNKTERLITGELGAYDGLKTTLYLDKFVQRQKFVKQVNDKYNTNIEVVPNVDIDLFNDTPNDNMEGVDDYVSDKL